MEVATNRTVNLKAAIGEKVFVKALEQSAIVRSVSVGRDGNSYEIVYFSNGDRKSAWLYESEFDVRGE